MGKTEFPHLPLATSRYHCRSLRLQLLWSLVFLMLNPSTSDFILAQLSSTLSLIFFIFPIHLYNFLKTKHIGSSYIVLTIIYSIIPGFIYNNQISVNKWFNFHDISHVLMAIFMFLMIIGTSKLSMIKTNEL